MIIPSIDIKSGQTVQLLQGRELKISAGPPLPWANEFSIFGEIAVIDLDAALGIGSNLDTILQLCTKFRCRVGGGIRTIERALKLLDAGARKVIIGTRAEPTFLSRLPKERVIVALDCLNGEVVTEGWTKGTLRQVEDKIAELRPYTSGFLITLVESEGTLQGIDLERCKYLSELCDGVPLTVAGGVNSVEEVRALDQMGIDTQVGMALYSGRFSYSDAIFGCLRQKTPDGLIPTVVVDEYADLLGLAYSSEQSFRAAIRERMGIYQSRLSGDIWRKGDTSGNSQELLRVEVDCDRDSLKFVVRQKGVGFCHRGTYSCFESFSPLRELIRTIDERFSSPVKDSYISELSKSQSLLDSKILEEVREFLVAAPGSETVHEAADLLFFFLVKLRERGALLPQVLNELAARRQKITRRSLSYKNETITGVTS